MADVRPGRAKAVTGVGSRRKHQTISRLPPSLTCLPAAPTRHDGSQWPSRVLRRHGQKYPGLPLSASPKLVTWVVRTTTVAFSVFLFVFTARCYASPILAMALCPSQVGVLLKRLNVESHKQHHTIAQGLYFLKPRISAKFDRGHPPHGGAKDASKRCMVSIKVE